MLRDEVGRSIVEDARFVDCRVGGSDVGGTGRDWTTLVMSLLVRMAEAWIMGT